MILVEPAIVGYNLTNAESETVGKTSVASNIKERFKSYSDAETKNFIVCSTEGLADLVARCTPRALQIYC